MAKPLILASGSQIRAQLLRNAGLRFDVSPADLDEDSVKTRLLAEGRSTAEIALSLATAKAKAVSEAHPETLVIGSDQIADLNGTILSKLESEAEAHAQLVQMAGQTHHLVLGTVIAQAGAPIWTHAGQVTMHMRPLTQQFIADYVTRNWNSIRHAVGAYKLEEEGARLFRRVEGDYFHVLGLPLLEILSYLIESGEVDT